MSNEQLPDLPPSYPLPEPSVAAGSPPRSRRRWLHYGREVLVGLGLLLGGLPLAWLLGIGAAQVIARPSHRMPLQEIALRRTNRVITEIYRLPSRWQPQPPPETRIEPIPIPVQPVVPLTTPQASLSQGERQIAQEELVALQQEFETIRNRLFDLESKLGQAQSTAEVESRLAALEQRLIPGDPSVSPPDPRQESAVPPPKIQPPNRVDDPLQETTELKITLPSDALFAPGEARLLATAPDLLGRIFPDLAQYPNVTILIGSHTDDRLEPALSRSLAFQQANALKAYLAGNLPDQRWVTVGYGQSQPITDNGTPSLRQRNRRIEIAIDRR